MKIKNQPVLLVILASLLFVFAACKEDLEDDIRQDFTTSYAYFSYNPEDTSSAQAVTISYDIGTSLSESALPSSKSPAFSKMRPGYTIDGWCYFKNPMTGSVAVPSNIKCEPYEKDGSTHNLVKNLVVTPAPAYFYVCNWSPITYYIVLDGNGGSYTDTSGAVVSASEKIAVFYDESKTLPANQFVRNGFTYQGWNKAENKGSTIPDYQDGETFINMTTTDGTVFTFYACWLKDKIDISFAAGDGSGTIAAMQQASVGDSLPACTFTAPTGKQFAYWSFTSSDGTHSYTYPDGAVLTEANYPNENATLTAQWMWIPCNVTFMSDGVTNSVQTVDWGTTATNYVPAKAGHNFVSWYTDSACTTEFDFSTVINQDCTLYAKWTPQTTTVTFDSDGGSAVSSVNISYTDLPYSPSATSTKDGYVFAGWSPSSITASNWNTSGITVKAIWSTRGSVIGTIPSGISVEYTATGMTFTATSGTAPYQWIIDGVTQTATGSTMSISYADYPSGTHLVFVGGTPGSEGIFTAGFQFTVQ